MTIQTPRAVRAADVPPRARPSSYPPAFAARMAGRVKRSLGDIFGLAAFGVNLTRLAPGAMSALMHAHSTQDEFIYVLEGELVLVTPEGESVLAPGMCAGFPAGGAAHHLINRSAAEAAYLEVGDRSPGDQVSYPADDLVAVLTGGAWRFARKDGTPY